MSSTIGVRYDCKGHFAGRHELRLYGVELERLKTDCGEGPHVSSRVSGRAFGDSFSPPDPVDTLETSDLLISVPADVQLVATLDPYGIYVKLCQGLANVYVWDFSVTIAQDTMPQNDNFGGVAANRISVFTVHFLESS